MSINVSETVKLAEELAAKYLGTYEHQAHDKYDLSHGDNRFKRGGIGEEFWQYREHDVNEPANNIDWRRSAKGERLYVREKERLNQQTFWLWVDSSASMSGERSAASSVLITALAIIYANAGERVGYAGNGEVLSHSETAYEIATHIYNERNGRTFFAGDAIPPYDKVIMAGDFFSDIDDIDGIFKSSLAHSQSLTLISLRYQNEVKPSYKGAVIFRNPETNAEMRFDDASLMVADYAHELEQYDNAIAAIASRNGGRFIACDIDSEPLSVVLSALLLP